MKVAATSDWHLGHRRHAATEGGRNVRERDIERALSRAVSNIITADPDLVLVPGDLFDNARPSYTAALAYRDAVERLVEGSRAVVILLQGNHCAVRTAGSTTPDRVVDHMERVHVVTEPQRVRFTTDAGERVAVACFPYTALQEEESYSLEPAEDADVNVLTLHGAVKGSEEGDALPFFYTSGRSLDVSREADNWAMIVAGDYHDYRRLHPERLAFYPGAIERVSSNPWDESAEKGVVVCDTETGELELVEHEVRGMESYDFHDIITYAESVSADTVNDALVEMVTWGADGDILRLVVEGFPREERQEIDWETVRELKATCLHFRLDLRWAEPSAATFRDRRDGPARTLESDAREFFEGDEPAVRDLALDYLDVEEETEEEVVYHGPDCGNRDTYYAGHEPPCSGGCGARMVEGSPPSRQLGAGGVS